MKYRLLLASFIIGTLSISGCKSFFGLERNKPLNPYQICSELKRKIIFSSHDPNHNTQWKSPRRKAILLQDYKKYNCSEILNEGESPVHTE